MVTLLTTPASQLEDTASGIYENTAENRAELGLDNPEFTVEVTAREKITYLISPSDGEYRYIIRSDGGRSDSGYILRVDSESGDFAYTTMERVAERYLAMIDIATLSSLDITHGGKTTHFTVIDGAGENAAFFMGDKELTAESFRPFYQQLVALPVSGVINDAPAENVIGTISYNLISGDRLVLEFAPYDERNYGVYINGTRQYTMLQKNVDKLFELEV